MWEARSVSFSSVLLRGPCSGQSAPPCVVPAPTRQWCAGPISYRGTLPLAPNNASSVLCPPGLGEGRPAGADLGAPSPSSGWSLSEFIRSVTAPCIQELCSHPQCDPVGVAV